MASTLIFILIVVACAVLLWLSFRLEPHWASKDGSRMICFGQGLSREGISLGRWREMRITKSYGDTLEVKPRRGSLEVDRAAPIPVMHHTLSRGPKKPSYWKVSGRTESSRKSKVVYLLTSCNGPEFPDMLTVRFPANSRGVAMFEEIAVNKQPASATPSTPSRETSSTEAQPDRD